MQFPMRFLAYLLARFSEPSSYAGLGAVLALLGVHFSDSLTGQIAQSLAALCALAALLLKERGIIKSLALTGVLVAGATLAACAPVAATAEKIDPALIAACDAALSPIAGPYAVWIDAGCGTAGGLIVA
jgi:sulfite exporter TauE/SafE